MDADRLDPVLITTITYLSNPLILPLILPQFRWIALRSDVLQRSTSIMAIQIRAGQWLHWVMRLRVIYS